VGVGFRADFFEKQAEVKEYGECVCGAFWASNFGEEGR
jgi:hypothetical protein